MSQKEDDVPDFNCNWLVFRTQFRPTFGSDTGKVFQLCLNFVHLGEKIRCDLIRMLKKIHPLGILSNAIERITIFIDEHHLWRKPKHLPSDLLENFEEHLARAICPAIAS